MTDRPRMRPGDNPAWLWHNFNTNGVTYGRWAKQEDASPYIRADIVLHALSASQSPPALDGAGRDAVIEECAKVAGAAVIAAEQIGTRGLRLTRKHEARRIAAAIRSIKETQ